MAAKNTSYHFDYIYIALAYGTQSPRYRVFGRHSNLDYEELDNEGIALGGAGTIVGVQKIIDYWLRQHPMKAVKWDDAIDLEQRDKELELSNLKSWVIKNISPHPGYL